jgi:sigma-E factor negative regulatory protein RseB
MRIFTALVVGWLSSVCFVQTATGAGAESSPQTATQWLERMGPALNMTSYRGVLVYARGDQVHSMQIAHRFRNGRVEERLVLQDGGGGEIVRKGMEVVCVLPERGRIRLDEVIPSGPFAETFASQWMPISEWYQPKLIGEGRVAGYEVVELALRARDEHRYSHRLWLEKDTGLLVKSQVREQDQVLEHFQFTSLEITDDIPDSAFQLQSEGVEVVRTLNADQGQQPEVSRLGGWALGWRPGGFVPAAAPQSNNDKAVAFSDGLATFSVFVEPLDKVKMPTGVSRIGATTIYLREARFGELVFQVVVVGEIPPRTARRVADGVDINAGLALEAGK